MNITTTNNQSTLSTFPFPYPYPIPLSSLPFHRIPSQPYPEKQPPPTSTPYAPIGKVPYRKLGYL